MAPALNAAEARDRGRAAGHEAAEQVWVSNRESRLRAAERHDEMLAWEPEVRRSWAKMNQAEVWLAQSSALFHARLEHPAEDRLARLARLLERSLHDLP